MAAQRFGTAGEKPVLVGKDVRLAQHAHRKGGITQKHLHLRPPQGKATASALSSELAARCPPGAGGDENALGRPTLRVGAKTRPAMICGQGGKSASQPAAEQPGARRHEHRAVANEIAQAFLHRAQVRQLWPRISAHEQDAIRMRMRYSDAAASSRRRLRRSHVTVRRAAVGRAAGAGGDMRRAGSGQLRPGTLGGKRDPWKRTSAHADRLPGGPLGKKNWWKDGRSDKAAMRQPTDAEPAGDGPRLRRHLLDLVAE